MSDEKPPATGDKDEELAGRLLRLEEQLARGEQFDLGLLDDASLSDRSQWSGAISLFRRLEKVRQLRALDGTGVTSETLGDSPQQREGPSSQREGGEELPSRVGRFEIVEHLGTGAFGIVLRARDGRLGRDVAIKIPRLGVMFNSELRERFLREAQAAAALDHPNIVAIHETGEAHGSCYIATAYCSGPTLDQWLRERTTPLPPRRAAWLVGALADAVSHAHSRRVVHRDLKPANVLLEPSDDGDTAPAESHGFGFVPKITDFGLAKIIGESRSPTMTGQILGTSQYMAPEQAGGKPGQTGPASDIYALGVILYELLVGRPPLVGDSDLETLQRVRNEEPLPPRRVRPAIGRDLETICLKCLHKDPHRRYVTAADLGEDLKRYLDSRPVLARRTGPIERGWRWCRRNPLPAGLLLVVLCIASVGVAGILWQWRQAEAARRTAVEQRVRAQASLARSRRAIDELLTQVAAERLVGEPRMVKVRKALLEKALAFYEELLREDDADFNLRLETARAQLRLSSCQLYLGQYEPARRTLKSGQQILAQLRDEFPRNPDARSETARAWFVAGRLQQVAGQHSQASEAYRKAIKTLEALPEESRQRPENQHLSGDVSMLLGELLANAGDGHRAEALYQQALRLLQPLVQTASDHGEYVFSLAKTYMLLGYLYQNTSRPDEALSRFRDAKSLLEPLIERNPLPDYREQLGMVFNGMAIVNNHQGDQQAAEAAYRKSLEALEPLVIEFPAVPRYQFSLAMRHWNLGLLLADGRLDPSETALAEFATAVEIVEQLIVEAPTPEYHASLASLYSYQGALLARGERRTEAIRQQRKACAIYDQLAADFPNNLENRSGRANAWHNLAMTLKDKGDFDESLEAFDKAIRHQQGAVQEDAAASEIRFLLSRHLWQSARLLDQMGREHEALDRFRRSIDLLEDLVRKEPNARRFVQQLNSVSLHLAIMRLESTDSGIRDPGDDVRLLEANTKRSPAFANYWHWLARALYENGQWNDALHAVRAAMRLKKDRPSCSDLFLLAMTLYQQHEIEAAREALRRGTLIMQRDQVDDVAVQTLHNRAATLLDSNEPLPSKATTSHPKDSRPKSSDRET